jgi:uncharacterized protein with HEPN domain
MTNRNYGVYLKDILIYCEKIQGFTIGLSFETFIADELRLLSVIRCLEVIGEACKKIPPEIKVQYPEITWKTIAGMRDYLIHDYMGVNNQLVWKTAINDIPDLLKNIQTILRDFERSGGSK